MLLNYQRINDINFYKFYLNFEGSKRDEKDQDIVMIIPCREVVFEGELKKPQIWCWLDNWSWV